MALELQHDTHLYDQYANALEGAGTDVQNKLVPCADPTILANVDPVQGGEQILEMRRQAPTTEGTAIVGSNATTPDKIPDGGASFVLNAKLSVWYHVTYPLGDGHRLS